MRTDEDIKASLEGAEPWQIANALMDGLETLVANDPDYFSDGSGNSLVHTLKMAAALVEGERMNRFVMYVPDLGCVYRWSDKYKQLEWNPLFANGILDPNEWGCVEEDAVGEEEVVVDGRKLTLSELYREIELKLGVVK
jgi:hypothetical protein